MKTIPLPLAALFATALFATLAIAEDKAPAEAKTPPAEPALPTTVAGVPDALTSKLPWNVHVEVLMVAMPQDMAMDLLPELRDPTKCEAAFTKILAAIKDKKATLMGYPMVETISGNRTVSEASTEQRYPTEFEAPCFSKAAIEAAKETKEKTPEAIANEALPTAFETRNLGATLEVQLVFAANGDYLELQVNTQRTELLGFDTFYSTKVKDTVSKLDQPRFFTSKTNTNITVRSGEHRLIAVHKLVKPEGFIELFILQATATPVK